LLSKTICEFTEFEKQDRNFYLVDSWGPMPGSHKNFKEDIFEQVKERFSKYPNVKLIRGIVPNILEQIPKNPIALLLIDLNSFEPELAALNFFYDRLEPGAIIYFDDYGWNYPKLREAVNGFFSDKPESLLHFPSGNSIVIKK